jgi:tripartite ATP-independent transporter DctM subunit
MLLAALLGIPLALAILTGALVYYFTEPALPTELMFQGFVSGTQSFPLLAIPFFVLMGELMTVGGMTRRLIDFAECFVGHLRGGLAQVNVAANALIGGPSGSGTADAAAISKSLVPEMERRGYDRAWSSALTAAGSVLGPMIPPGIGLILFGFFANVSIGALFLGAVVPGLLLAVAISALAYVASRRRGYLPSRERIARPAEMWTAFVRAAWALFLPFLILVGIRFGLFTPTEAAAVGVVYALLVGFIFYRTISVRDLGPVLTSTVRITAVVMLLVAVASALGRMLTWEAIPNQVADFLVGISSNPYVFLAIVNAGLLVLGCLMEGTALLIIMTPLLMPTVRDLGIDPVVFGVVFVLNVTIGALHPPFGSIMYTVCAVNGITIMQYLRAVWPFLLVLIFVLLMITYLQPLITFLPSLIEGEG